MVFFEGREWTMVEPLTKRDGETMFKSTKLVYITNLGWRTVRIDRFFLLGSADGCCDQCAAHGSAAGGSAAGDSSAGD